MSIDLKKFCWSGTSSFRLDLAEPFSDDQYTYASNGHIMVRVARRDDVTHTDAEKTAVFSGYLADVEKITFSPFPDVELPEVPPYVPTPCKTCKETGRIHRVECRKCKGKGTIECPTCHGSDECEHCNGLGTTDRPATTEDDPKDVADCDDCGGTGDVNGGPDEHDPIVFTKVGPYWIDRKYVVLMQDLPGLEIDLNHTVLFAPVHPFGDIARPVIFRFVGGVGGIMPLRGDPSPREEVASSYDQSPTDPHHGGKVGA